MSAVDRLLSRVPAPTIRHVLFARRAAAGTLVLLAAASAVGLVRTANGPSSPAEAAPVLVPSSTASTAPAPPTSAIAPAPPIPTPSWLPTSTWTPPAGSSPGATGGTVAIPRQHVVAPVDQCAIVDDELDPPQDVSRACEWMGGAPITSTTGTTLIAGHINWVGQGTGALGNIGNLRPGDVVYTDSAGSPATEWRVQRVEHRSKSQGVNVAAFAGVDGERLLYLITCGGAFDAAASNYLDNIYVRAVPVTAVGPAPTNISLN